MAEVTPFTGEPPKKRGWPKGKPRKPKVETPDIPPDPAIPPDPVPSKPVHFGYEDLKHFAQTIFASGGLSHWYDRPEKVLMVIEYGQEVGLTPVQAIAQIIPSDDGLTLSPEGMRALILQTGAGHILPVEETDDECVVEAVRYWPTGETGVHRFSYSVAEAAKDGLFARESWRSGANRRGLLYGRATSRAVRALFPDITKGLGYTPEELAREALTVPTAQPAVSPAEPAVDRTLRYQHEVPAKGGGVRSILTAGINGETLFKIHRATIESGGNASWKAALIRGQEYLNSKGLKDLKSLTQEEGNELLAMFFPPPPPPPEKMDIWVKFLKEYGLLARELDILTLLAQMAGKDKNELSQVELRQAVDDLMKLADDPTAFDIMLDRARQVQELGG